MILLLQGAPEPVTLCRMAREYAGFLSYFAVYGALGFHFQVLKSLRSADRSGDQATVEWADRRAAQIGILGSVLMGAALFAGIAAQASRKHTPILEAITGGGGRQTFQIACVCVLAVCFAVATQRIRIAWLLAGATAIALALRNIVTGRWFSMVNPLHEVAASLWLGTLLVLVVAGMGSVFRVTTPREERGTLVAEMVSRFSPLALSAATLLGITGVTTAWRHLKHLDALWTTPYGYALDAKLCVVLIVVFLGAWNWRRMKPQLGDERAAQAIKRSATAELSFAAVVLALTSLLVSLPSPGPPGPPSAASVPGEMKTTNPRR
jgi:putative copper export protein